MKVLVVTRSAWDNSNSTGNTMSVFWNNISKENIANLYFREVLPVNDVCNLYYSISDQDIIKSIVNPFFKPGKQFNYLDKSIIQSVNKNSLVKEDIAYSYFRRRTSILALILQEFIWLFGRWKNKKLNFFLSTFKPDIIFFPCFFNSYTHNVLWYIQKKTNAKVVLFHADDYISDTVVKDESFFNKKFFDIRKKQVKKSILKADLNYCISEKQQREYEKILNKEMKILYKGADFTKQPIKRKRKDTDVIKIVYIGSTLYGRWLTLGMLASAIKILNNSTPYFELEIYSQYEPSEEATRKMIIEGASKFMGKLSPSDVQKVMKNADIVLHVESFNQKEKMKTRLSFSTKIVDCLASGRTLMAIGWHEAASIDYLVQNDAALVAYDEASILEQLKKIIDNPDILDEYAQKAWECGKRNHQIDKIQKRLYDDLNTLL